MCCRERAIPMQKYLFPIRLQWARHRLFAQRGADSAKEGIRAGKSVRCRVACGGLLAKGAVFRGKWRSAVHPSSQRAASAVAAHCIGTRSALRFLHVPFATSHASASLNLHTQLEGQVIAPGAVDGLQSRPLSGGIQHTAHAVAGLQSPVSAAARSAPQEGAVERLTIEESLPHRP